MSEMKTHNIISLIHDCIESDSSFLSDIPSVNHEIVQKAIQNHRNVNNRDINTITRDDYGEFRDLFRIVPLLEHYKYIGIPIPKNQTKRPVGIGTQALSLDHIQIIKSIWNYLNYPKGTNQIKNFIERHNGSGYEVQISTQAIHFLSQLIEI